MQADELVGVLAESGQRFAVVAVQAGAATPVPTCPGWTMFDLVEHVTRVHAYAVHSLQARPAVTFEPPERGRTDAVARFGAGLDQLVAALRAARPAENSVGRGSAFFWARRMAHEMMIHRLDAEIAADTGMLDVPARFAADGVDELITGFAPSSFAVSGIAPGRTITLMPLDVNRAWTLSITSQGVRPAPVATERADLTVAAMAGELYRWVWNRGGDDVVLLSGDLKLADLWRSHFTVSGGG